MMVDTTVILSHVRTLVRCPSQGAGSTEGSDSINRTVEADTPEATRLVFGGSDYGKDQEVLNRSEEKQAELDALAAKAGAGIATAKAAPIHHDRSVVYLAAIISRIGGQRQI